MNNNENRKFNTMLDTKEKKYLHLIILSNLIIISLPNNNLHADEQIKHPINNQTKIYEKSIAGRYLFCENGRIENLSRVVIKAKEGSVRFSGGNAPRIDGKSKVLIEAKLIKLHGHQKIAGESLVLVIISKDGQLDTESVERGSSLFYSKSNDDDPEPKVIIRSRTNIDNIRKISQAEMRKLIENNGLNLP